MQAAPQNPQLTLGNVQAAPQNPQLTLGKVQAAPQNPQLTLGNMPKPHPDCSASGSLGTETGNITVLQS